MPIDRRWSPWRRRGCRRDHRLRPAVIDLPGWSGGSTARRRLPAGRASRGATKEERGSADSRGLGRVTPRPVIAGGHGCATSRTDAQPVVQSPCSRRPSAASSCGAPASSPRGWPEPCDWPTSLTCAGCRSAAAVANGDPSHHHCRRSQLAHGGKTKPCSAVLKAAAAWSRPPGYERRTTGAADGPPRATRRRPLLRRSGLTR